MSTQGVPGIALFQQSAAHYKAERLSQKNKKAKDSSLTILVI